MSGEIVSLVLQLGGALAVMQIAAKTRKRRLSIWIGVPLMLVVSTVAQTIIAGEGIAAPLAFVVLSALAVILIYLSAPIAERLCRTNR